MFPFKITEMGKYLQKHIAFFFSDYKVIFSNNLTGVSLKGISVDRRASFPCAAISASVYPDLSGGSQCCPGWKALLRG